MVAWLAVRTSKTATCQLLRIAWRTIGSIITRVNNDVEAVVDRLDGLRRIGIDEISSKRGQRYLIVAVNHDTEIRNYVWRRRAQGLSTREIMRCLKRCVSRQTIKHLPRAA